MIKATLIGSAAIVAALLAGVAGVSNPVQATPDLPVRSEAGKLRLAVQTLHQSSQAVQLAVYRDACLGWDRHAEHRTGMSKLVRQASRARYVEIGRRLTDAYRASLGTDAACEQVERDFCSAARSELQRQGVVR